jgi:ABC-type glycerol-3-phosphate transport system substrate-binding protein
LLLWLPPEFDPNANNRAAALLKERLDAFAEANNIQIQVRLKTASGPGGMLESLSAASAAAPLALPSLVALSRPDLETAALKSLLIPLEGSTTVLAGEDWYEYARSLARVQDTPFGLPFAGDALLLVYRPSQVTVPPASWDGIRTLEQPFAFPAAAPHALATLALYQSGGAEIVDTQGRPLINAANLSQILALYEQAAQKGVFPAWLAQYDSDAQVWQAYSEFRVHIALTWSSYFLTNPPADTTVLPLPAPTNGVTSLATAWSWGVTDPIPERRQLAVSLAEWLVEPAFLGAWTEAAGYLPTRPTALEKWRDGGRRAVLGQVVLNARARPSNDLLSSLGPPLRDAVVSIIRLESDAATAANTAAQRISNPPAP